MRILLSLDGSEKDERAIQVANAFATLSDADIHLVRVVPIPLTKTSVGMAMLGLAVEREDLREEVKRRLRDTAARLASVSGPTRKVTWELIDGVDVASELLRRAEEREGADLIVMATRAPGAVERAFFGSVADTIVRDAYCPVVVVPPGAHYASGKLIALRRALVPLDGSAASASVIDRMLDLLPTGRIEYVLMRVVQTESAGGYMMPEPVPPVLPGGAAALAPHLLHVQAERAEQRLNEGAARLRQLGENASVLVSESGDPAAAIHEAIRGELVDLIAMSTRGLGGFQRMLLGSVANRVVRESEVPVWLVTPRSSESAHRS